MAVEAPHRPKSSGAGPRVSALFWRRPGLRAGTLLAAPLGWFVFVYLAALAVLLITAFWQINPFTTAIVRVWSLTNFRTLLSNATYRAIAMRTIGMAAAVTLTDALLAFPVAFFMAKVAAPRTQRILFGAILLPLWASYIARVYSWQLIFTHDGILNWSLGKLGLPPIQIAYTNWAMWIVFCYIWLPFMIIPVYAALERVPTSLIEASADLGGRGGRTLRQIILPLALPGIAAGSIFTFSLTLGDYITALLVGGTGGKLIGNVVYESVGISNNVPFAAAFATLPIVIMALYLFGARRLGAFEAL
jgi:putative spermidine/putrescine transport system permease protein